MEEDCGLPAKEGLSSAERFSIAGVSLSLLVLGPRECHDASPDPATVAPHYDDPVGAVMRKFLTVHGKQPGDPQKGVERIFEAVTGTGLAGPLAGKISRLVLGSDAYARLQKSGERFNNDLSLQEEVALSTNYA